MEQLIRKMTTECGGEAKAMEIEDTQRVKSRTRAIVLAAYVQIAHCAYNGAYRPMTIINFVTISADRKNCRAFERMISAFPNRNSV